MILRPFSRINPSSPQARGLVAAWPLNDGGGAVARSCCGRINGILVNSPTWNTWQGGRALTFTAVSSQYVAFPVDTNALFNGATQLTLSGWFKRTTATASPNSSTVSVSCRTGGGTNGVYVGFFWDGRLYVIARNSNNAAGYIELNDTKRYHVTMVFDGSGTGDTGRLKLYLNGIPQTLTYTNTVQTSITTTGALSIGFDTAGTAYDNGEITDVRIYNRALSAYEVKDIYVNPLKLYTSQNIFALLSSLPQIQIAETKSYATIQAIIKQLAGQKEYATLVALLHQLAGLKQYVTSADIIKYLALLRNYTTVSVIRKEVDIQRDYATVVNVLKLLYLEKEYATLSTIVHSSEVTLDIIYAKLIQVQAAVEQLQETQITLTDIESLDLLTRARFLAYFMALKDI